MTPYYVTPCGSVRIYHARWEDVLAAGAFDPREVKLIHADPPYGVKERTDRASKGRVGSLARHSATVKNGKRVSAVGMPHDFPAVAGDETPFDPAPLLSMELPLVLWGANHYAGRVPGGPSWILWDKREDQTPDDNADGELAWTNLGGPLRIFRHWWRGALRKTEKEHVHMHPTQKPEALSAWVFQRARLKRGDLVLVPYMGSGPDLRPAMAMGLRVVACELEELYCRTAVNARLHAVAKQEAPDAIGPLFGGAS
jgi:site-specific DNA-methyltransferase (adenine-specific)